MKKIALLALGAVTLSSAQAAVYYDQTTGNGFFFPAANVWMIADDLTLASVGPINSFIVGVFSDYGTGGSYNGQIRVGLADRTGTTVPPPAPFSTVTGNFTLATGAWRLQFVMPEATPAGADIWGQVELLNNTTPAVAGSRIGVLNNGVPTIGTSQNLFAWDNGGTGTQWGPWWFGATSNANFEMRVGWVGNGSISTTVGEEFGGDLTSLDADDDNQYCSFNDPVTLACSMELVAEVNAVDALVMGYDMIYKVDRPGLACAIYLYKDSTNAYAFNQGFTANTAEESRSFQTATAAEAADYVSATGQVKMRIDFAPINEEDPSQDGWLHCLEQVEVFAL